MFAARLARLLSVLLTSTMAVVLPAPIVVPTAIAQQASVFAGVDYTSLSIDELTTVVTAAVNAMPPGSTDAEIVATIGAQLCVGVNSCTPVQIAALARNVALILQELGIEIPDMEAVLVAAIAAPDIPFVEGPGILTATVY